MRLTDQKAINIFKRLKCAHVIESIKTYPEDEIDGRSDLQMLADEISYYRSCYQEDGHVLNDDLEWSRELLRETQNGKIIPIDRNTFKPKRGYYPHDIESAKNVIAEYKQLQYYESKLAGLGYIGKW